MFERYTEHARRVIFFARYQASEFGSSEIATEHLLLGLVREDKRLIEQLTGASADFLREQVKRLVAVGTSTSTSVDLPLTEACKRVLAHGADEADRLHHRHIGNEHLLLGILTEENSVAAQVLRQNGVTLEAARNACSQH